MTRKTLAFVLVLAFLATTAFAAPTVRLHATPDSISFSSDFAHGTATLGINGPDGYVARYEFASHETPSFVSYDELGDLADGSYTWELLLVSPVSGQAREALRRAREAGDERAPAKLGVRSQTFSGHFLIADGTLVVPEVDGAEEAGSPVAEAGPADAYGESRAPNKAQVFATDLIVQGSACVGVDCTSSESFGFDTIRLKENNLRIKFDDTSSSGSFPNNDWQLVANDTNNGGANKFSVEDVTNSKTPFTIEANTPNNTLYVDADQRIGIGTSSPVVDVHVKQGNTPALRLEQDGSAGFTAQTWDLAGNETNFFLRDISHSSKLPFRVQPDAPKNSIFIYSDGDVGMGTVDGGADAPLHVRRTDGTAALYVQEASSTQDSRNIMTLENNGQLNFILERTDGTSGRWVFAHNGAAFGISKGGSGVSEFSLADGGDLTIAGSLRANSGTDVFPDYVFDEGYELRSIDELAAFITENGHLPNVASREEVQAQGYINHTELQLQTLEKVEELALYTIEQQRLIEEQAAMIQELRARLDATP